MRSDFSQAMEAKLRGYMDQDTASGRTWEPEDYVDVAHIMELHSAQGACARTALRGCRPGGSLQTPSRPLSTASTMRWPT